MVALGGRRLIREPNTAEIPVPGAPSTTAPKPVHRAHTAATVAFSGLTVSCLSLPDGLGQMWLRATPANAPSSLLSHPVVEIRMFKASSLHMALDPDMQSNFPFERTVAVEMAFPSIFNELYLLLPQHQLPSSNSGWVKIRFTIDANARAKVGLLSASKCIQSAGHEPGACFTGGLPHQSGQLSGFLRTSLPHLLPDPWYLIHCLVNDHRSYN